MTSRVRAVAAQDLAHIADIVNHYIEHGAIHFGETPQTATDRHARWWPLKDDYPWLVAQQDEAVVGVAYAKPWNTRAAYDWTAEVTIYLRHGHAGRGTGKVLYGRLLQLLDAQGFRTIVAGITIPNEPSARLHDGFGFELVGTLQRVGYKQGAWHDVGLWQRQTSAADDPPRPIRPLAQIDGAASLR